LHCFICRGAVKAHVITALESAHDGQGWTRLCVPCAMRHGLDGALVARPEDRELADRWEEDRRGPPERRSSAR
jgi:hypothetical protein